jgi:hypothetical protein
MNNKAWREIKQSRRHRKLIVIIATFLQHPGDSRIRYFFHQELHLIYSVN